MLLIEPKVFAKTYMTMASKQRSKLAQADLLSDLRERNVVKVPVEAYYEDLDLHMTQGASDRPWQTFELR